MCELIQDHLGLCSYLDWLLEDNDAEECEIGQALLGELREYLWENYLALTNVRPSNSPPDPDVK